jgi:Holliday junction resolvase
MNSNKIKGDKAEREACALLTEFTGYEVERRFGAGMENDKGDLVGIPDTVVQVCDLKNKSDAVLRKPREAEQQRLNAKVDHAITMVRFNKRLGCKEGDNWRVVMTIEQYARLINDIK